MKKLYSFIIASTIGVMSFTANAATINVQVGAGGNNFTPMTFSCNVGDVIHFVLAGGVHDVTGVAAPAGAAPIMSGTMTTVGQSYDYTVTVAGSYAYYCSIHGSSMAGGFSATGSSSVAEVNGEMATVAYPNPFADKVTFRYNGIESIEIINVIGEKVKTVAITSIEGKVEVDFAGMPAGVYFFRTYNEGAIVETKKIVKAK